MSAILETETDAPVMLVSAIESANSEQLRYSVEYPQIQRDWHFPKSKMYESSIKG